MTLAMRLLHIPFGVTALLLAAGAASGQPGTPQAPGSPQVSPQLSPQPGRGGRGGNFNAEPQWMALWEQGAPGALGETAADRPSITFYRPPGRAATGTAV